MTQLVQIRAVIIRWHTRIQQHPRLTLLTFILAGMALSLWLLTRPGALWGPIDVTWHRVQVNKDLYVGVDPSYPPFAEWTPEQIVGIEPDIAREIGRRLGVKTQILIMGFDGLYDSLYTGGVDMVIAGLRADPGLDEWVYYSRPYFDAGQILVSSTDHPVQNIRQMEGKTVAVELASSGEQTTRRWSRRLHKLTVVHFLLPEEAMQAVQRGKADAALVDSISARLYVNQNPDLVMAAKTTAPEGYVIAMRDENYRLTAAVDRALADMIKDGTLNAIIAQWLDDPQKNEE
jgi:polar amino acid transport system substrate-binding protein